MNNKKSNEKKKKKNKVKDLDWKESLFKSSVYRVITVALGFLTAYMITGDLAVAFGVAMLTEFVQFINYFLFEVAWTNLRTRKRIEEELRKKIVDLEINYDSIRELAYEMSQVETFIKEVYESTLNFLTSVLKNEELSELHDEVLKYTQHFTKVHEKRQFYAPKTVNGA